MRIGGGGLATPARLGDTHEDVMIGLLGLVAESGEGGETAFWRVVEDLEALPPCKVVIVVCFGCARCWSGISSIETWAVFGEKISRTYGDDV